MSDELKTWPERIWLQHSEDGYPTPVYKVGTNEVSWCEDKVYDCDVEYVRADLSTSAPSTQHDTTQNTPWLTLAHTVCADAGIPPGHITDRLERLRERIAPAVQGPAAFVPIHPRNGLLWANAITSIDQDHPSYQLMPSTLRRYLQYRPDSHWCQPSQP